MGRTLFGAALPSSSGRTATGVAGMTSSFGLPIALVLGLLFGVLLWFLSPLSVAVLIVAVVIGLNLLRRPLLGLLLFAAVATVLPYSTLNIGLRTVSGALHRAGPRSALRSNGTLRAGVEPVQRVSLRGWSTDGPGRR